MSNPYNTHDRRQRRYSSGSSVFGNASSTSGPSANSDKTNTAISEAAVSGNTRDRQNSSLSSKIAGSANSRAEEGMDEKPPNLNRWSTSTTSSASTAHHRRHSSFSKRFSFSTGFRPSSPIRKRPPSDTHSSSPSNSNAVNTPSDNSSAALPSLRRFSPLTVPDVFSQGGIDQSVSNASRSPKSPITASKPLPPAPFAASNTDRPDETSSPSKRLRDGSNRAPSRLSDIVEAARPTTQSSTAGQTKDLNATPRAMSPVGSPPSKADPHRPKSRSGNVESASGQAAPTRKRSKRDKEKKAMLAQALQRANDAVYLDNEQNFTDAVTAYQEACSLLAVVMTKTNTDYDKQKLTKIRATYLTRAEELEQMLQPTVQDRSSVDSYNFRERDSSATRGENSSAALDTATSRGNSVGQHSLTLGSEPGPTTAEQDQAEDLRTTMGTGIGLSESPGDELPIKNAGRPPSEAMTVLPLSLRREPPVSHARQESSIVGAGLSQREGSALNGSYRREIGASWLDGTPEEKARSSMSPHHSISSTSGMHRRNLLYGAGESTLEFDAAFDAAIESAYNEGFEPFESDFDRSSTTVRRSVLGQPQRESQTIDPLSDQARSYEQRQVKIQRLSQKTRPNEVAKLDELLSDAGSDTEAVDDEPSQLSGINSRRPAVPRESDSSGFSSRTHDSSIASSLNTGGTSLTTVDENVSMGSHPASGMSGKMVPSVPPVLEDPVIHSDADVIEETRTSPSKTTESKRRSRSESPNGLRDRRRSSQKPGKLRIETTVVHSGDGEAPYGTSTSLPVRGAEESQEELRLGPPKSAPLLQDPTFVSPLEEPSALFKVPTTQSERLKASLPTPLQSPAFTSNRGSPTSTNTSPPKAPVNRAERPYFRQNFSSLGISKEGIFPPDDADASPGTPLSFGSLSMSPPGLGGAAFSQSGLKTPLDGSFSLFPVPATKMKIFDHEIHSSASLGVANRSVVNAPHSLEPCPEKDLLRPFWLMRCFHQTLTHSKGGYVSKRLFIPHDVWKVKNNKLRGVEEKAATCDLLTAALMKLSAVDTLDAEAVLEEMQAFENVLEQAQASLNKKLGSDVGLNSVNALFRDAANPTNMGAGNVSTITEEPEGTHPGAENQPGDIKSTGSAKGSTKLSLNSWRKLRNKSSSAALEKSSSSSSGKDGMTSKGFANGLGTANSSIPMTDNMEIKREARVLKTLTGTTDAVVDGPNANYASALARLCEAVQVLDQITRQVSDPGLKGSSSAHVGIELSARHAAEFFSFYVCRFVLQDLTLLTEKFMKRATEWVLA